eukprot:m.1004366 g.1004366  ORF g.1004366 m.1004366 type:complete len:247 (+) comp24048_c0_seq22:113-853(+)
MQAPTYTNRCASGNQLRRLNTDNVERCNAADAYITDPVIRRIFDVQDAFDTFFDHVRRGCVYKRHEREIAQMSMTPAIKDILARLLTYEDSTQRNVLHYAVVQCNETLVKKILVALALVQPPGGIERTIRQVDSYGKNILQIACDIAIMTTGVERARDAVSVAKIFTAILKVDGRHIIKLPWWRCNMAQKQLWLGISYQLLEDWFAEEQRLGSRYNPLERRLQELRGTHTICVYAQALLPYSMSDR